MNIMYCPICGIKIDSWDYWNKRYCSNKCRQRYHRYQNMRNAIEQASKSVEGVTTTIHEGDNNGNRKHKVY